MLRAISLAVLMTFAAPSAFAAPLAEDATIAQQQSPQQTPKRDCEKKQDEGVS
ncbi:MAG: hypothetical protein ABW003_12830 [Microvirga sp.]